MTEPRRKQWVIARKDPVITSGYPYPECITGGWTALLTDDEKGIVDAKVNAMKSINKTFYSSYTGFDALDSETQKSICDKLDANKQWEKEHGRLWFREPMAVDPNLLNLPKDYAQQTGWQDKYKADARIWLVSRQRQAMRMIARNEYPVRSYIYRT